MSGPTPPVEVPDWAWDGWAEGSQVCVACGYLRTAGHAPDCGIVALVSANAKLAAGGPVSDPAPGRSGLMGGDYALRIDRCPEELCGHPVARNVTRLGSASREWQCLNCWTVLP